MLFIPVGAAAGFTASLFISKNLKKKNQFIMASCIMIVSAGLISLSYYLKNVSEEITQYKLFAQILFSVGMFGMTSGYGAGYGSVIYTLPGELLAPEDKSMGGAAAESSRMIVEAMAYPYILDVFGFSVVFLGHAVAIFLSAIFVFKVLPETDDKSITEIQALINKTDKEAEVGLLKPYPYFEKDDDGQF
ncbi:uncharacterized protein LOC111716779 isoform X2 [Eurytemora carolleeae]|uniref:uncharacterized protein LOC111716779 isoform X2 n=1 Tax=Eurytemora carolleeae TaxID=1294199 RepID=UPI000C78D3C4|nr:uncharacterized protein LOC111716779 isoform X2 [Eurytemora carolleeae]|eukprot:XP_023348034.1 uncharacterized protein LOC111716779 isoform X2 [Eurytemora affinis]